MVCHTRREATIAMIQRGLRWSVRLVDAMTQVPVKPVHARHLFLCWYALINPLPLPFAMEDLMNRNARGQREDDIPGVDWQSPEYVNIFIRLDNEGRGDHDEDLEVFNDSIESGRSDYDPGAPDAPD